MKKWTNRILITSGGFLIITIGIFYFLYNFSESKHLEDNPKTTDFFCGTVLAQNGRMGKQLFNIHCAACHKLNSKATGPALAKTDSILFWNWLTLKKNGVDRTKFNEMGIDYHRNLWGTSLKSTELIELYEYIDAE